MKGDQELSSISAHGELPKILPSVVLDAMFLVVSLGFRHLWIDRFCINQGDKEERNHRISQKDQIYEGALATIVAASSKAANRGLRGVSVSRVATPFVQISEQISLQALYGIGKSLAASEWNKRGWTYQEFCLSRRCLILADDQVHFVCKRGTTCEGVEEAAISNLPFQMHKSLNPGMLQTFRPSANPTFVRHLEMCTRRVLSYDSDKFNAFHGILSRSQLASYWGVPVYNTDPLPHFALASVKARDLARFQLGFSLGLCWFAMFPPELRRIKPEGLPSWSWVSSSGTALYPHSLVAERKNDELWVDNISVETFAQVFLDDPFNTDQESITAMTRLSGDPPLTITENAISVYITSSVKAIPMQLCSQFSSGVWWDCGDMSSHLDSPLQMILLVHKHSTEELPKRFYMIVTMEGDTAHRVGLAHINDEEELLLTDLGVKTFKVA